MVIFTAMRLYEIIKEMSASREERSLGTRTFKEPRTRGSSKGILEGAIREVKGKPQEGVGT